MQLTIPKDGGESVDLNSLSVKIMAVDHQTNSESEYVIIISMSVYVKHGSFQSATQQCRLDITVNNVITVCVLKAAFHPSHLLTFFFLFLAFFLFKYFSTIYISQEISVSCPVYLNPGSLFYHEVHFIVRMNQS